MMFKVSGALVSVPSELTAWHWYSRPDFRLTWRLLCIQLFDLIQLEYLSGMVELSIACLRLGFFGIRHFVCL